MELKMATTSLHWAQPLVPHPSSSKTLAPTLSSPSTRYRALRCRYIHKLHGSTLSGTTLTNPLGSQSCDYVKVKALAVKRSCSCNASLNDFPDEEFFKQIEEMALTFQYSADNDYEVGKTKSSHATDSNSETGMSSWGSSNNFIQESSNINSAVNFLFDEIQFPHPNNTSFENPWLEVGEEMIGPEDDYIIAADIERKANSVDLPLSLRFIKKKMRLQDCMREAGDSAYSSVQKAFSSMVFMIQELHSYTLQLREILYLEDLQCILSRVQREIHSSFVWLFQQVFSRTPTLMVYLMILLANFTVHSMGLNAAIASALPLPPYAQTAESALVLEFHDPKHNKFDSTAIKKLSISSSIGGNNGGGGKVRPTASSTDGHGRFDQSGHYQTIIPDGSSQLSSLVGAGEAESVASETSIDKEVTLWNSIVEEASKMRADCFDETLHTFVSPVTAKMEANDYADYLRTELMYQTGLAEEPDNPLLLANYAQFLYVVAHDYDRAEEYFKRSVEVKPGDAEACHKYATFLCEVRKDFWQAEEAFLEAISAEPGNSFYSGNYAHFLWHTGGEETCYPLTSPDVSREV